MKKLLPILSLVLSGSLYAQQGDIAAVDGALPENTPAEPTLELVSFEVRNHGMDEVDIRWATLSERAAERFLLERSADLVHWELLLEIPGEGASGVHTGYHITDDLPLTGTAYYRIRNQEAHRIAELSDLASVYRPQPEKLMVLPDREPGRFRIKAEGELAEVRIMNSRGQFIPMLLEPVDRTVVVDTATLEPGTYYIQASVDGVPALAPVTVTPTGIVGG